MANSATPFGFREQGIIDGLSANAGMTRGYVKYNCPLVGYGDVLVFSNAFPGYHIPAVETAGGAQISGIFVSASWISVAEGKRVFKKFYPGNDSVSNADVEVTILTNPMTVLECMPLNASLGGAITQAQVGRFANFSPGVGGTITTGGAYFSSFALDDATLSTVQGNLPFKIIYIEQQPKTDPTSANNLIRVQMVNLSGGV